MWGPAPQTREINDVLFKHFAKAFLTLFVYKTI